MIKACIFIQLILDNIEIRARLHGKSIQLCAFALEGQIKLVQNQYIIKTEPDITRPSSSRIKGVNAHARISGMKNGAWKWIS
tara:strand:- start:17 stop:262 length:246 start_codon:yes stop_codon:yes gene_type:complete